MGKIDKEKLLKEIKLKSDDVDVTWVCSFIKNFPEEPEIDFYALYNEWAKLPGDGMPYDQSFNNFLRSKNFTAPKSFEIPVKKTWTLKKHVEEIFHDFGDTPFTSYIRST